MWAFWFASEAVAAFGSCASGDAPGAYLGATCHAVCTRTGGFFPHADCSTQASAAYPTELWVVTNRAGGDPNRVSAWGTDSDGSLFCCADPNVDGTSVDTFGVQGTDGVDDLNLTESADYLDDPVGTFVIQVTSYDGFDTIVGTDSSVETVLYGGDDIDTIDTLDGTDMEVYGGPDLDFITGGDGPYLACAHRRRTPDSLGAPGPLGRARAR